MRIKRILQKFVGKNASVQKIMSMFLLKEGYEQTVTDDIVSKLDLPSDTHKTNEIILNTLLESVVEV